MKVNGIYSKVHWFLTGLLFVLFFVFRTLMTARVCMIVVVYLRKFLPHSTTAGMQCSEVTLVDNHNILGQVLTAICCESSVYLVGKKAQQHLYCLQKTTSLNVCGFMMTIAVLLN